MSPKSSSSWQSLLGCCGNPAPGRPARAKSLVRSRLSSADVSSPEDLSLSLMGCNLCKFTVTELEAATSAFSEGNFIGEGGFGPVYKGFLDSKVRAGLAAQPVAVKLLDLEGVQGHKEWMAEVIFLGQLRHPHLVKLVGYCYEQEHRLLVYEYMARGSLENHLFKRFSTSLPWATRLKIAVGAAKGLAFLHQIEQPVIYRDFKASNILLDSRKMPHQRWPKWKCRLGMVPRPFGIWISSTASLWCRTTTVLTSFSVFPPKFCEYLSCIFYAALNVQSQIF